MVRNAERRELLVDAKVVVAIQTETQQHEPRRLGSEQGGSFVQQSRHLVTGEIGLGWPAPVGAPGTRTLQQEGRVPGRGPTENVRVPEEKTEGAPA